MADCRYEYLQKHRHQGDVTNQLASNVFSGWEWPARTGAKLWWHSPLVSMIGWITPPAYSHERTQPAQDADQMHAQSAPCWPCPTTVPNWPGLLKGGGPFKKWCVSGRSKVSVESPSLPSTSAVCPLDSASSTCCFHYSLSVLSLLLPLHSKNATTDCRSGSPGDTNVAMPNNYIGTFSSFSATI